MKTYLKTRRGMEVLMCGRNSIRLFQGVALLFLVAVAGCAAPGQPTARVTSTTGPSIQEARMESYTGPRARIAVGDFQVKAAGATVEIGDGLREMLITALFNSNRYIVLERQALQDVVLEQDLGASGRVNRETAAPIGRLEGAEILVYGAVTEFDADSGGVRLGIGLPNVPLTLGGGMKNAHIAIDLRAVDTTTGRILFASRVEGKASDYDTQIGTRIGGGSSYMPIALGAYKNTPMEKAIRVCIDTAVCDLSQRTPANYYHY